MRREIGPFDVIPPFYGVAYRWPIDVTGYCRDVSVCYPIPINRIIRLYRHLLAWFKVPQDMRGAEAGGGELRVMLREQWKAGYDAGREDGERDGEAG